jgi:hypothetical protein
MSIHRTATGKFIDINALKIQQEHTIAVGNARTNARGDLLGAGGQIIKTRDEIMTEFYQGQVGRPATSSTISHSTEQAQSQAVADIFADPTDNGMDLINNSADTPNEVISPASNATPSGVADALAKSAELAARLKTSRNRI